MIENTVYQILANMNSISSAINGRIYYEINQNQDESQFLIYKKVAHDRRLSVNLDRAMNRADFQIDIYSPNEDTARNIRESLIDEFHGKSNSTYSDSIDRIYIDADYSGFVSDPFLYRITISLAVYF